MTLFMTFLTLFIQTILYSMCPYGEEGKILDLSLNVYWKSIFVAFRSFGEILILSQGGHKILEEGAEDLRLMMSAGENFGFCYFFNPLL